MTQVVHTHMQADPCCRYRGDPDLATKPVARDVPVCVNSADGPGGVLASTAASSPI